MSKGNTIGILVPQPSPPAAVSNASANPPEPLTNAAGPVEAVGMVADVAASALALYSPEAAAKAEAVATALSLIAMVPGQSGPIPPAKTTVKAFSGGSSGGSDGGYTDGSGSCIPCKVAAAVGKPVNAVLGIKILPDETDFAVDSPLPLVWQRSYYSDQLGNGWLGQGWSLPFSMRLIRTYEGFLYIDGQGREIKLPDIGDETEPDIEDGESETPLAVSAEEDPYGLADAYFDRYEQIYFSQLSDGLYQIASADGGARLWFAEVNPGDTVYQLIAQLDRNHRHIRLCYGDNGLPHSVYDGSGRQFSLGFSSVRLNDRNPGFDAAAERDVFVGRDGKLYVNRLTAVTLNGRELVRYAYNEYGDLTAVYGRDGKKLRGFAYRNHIMTEHSQPDGLVSRYEYDRYDTGGKVLKSSNNSGEQWTFDYRDGHTRVTDALGREEVYGFDENFELVYRIDANGRRSDSERDGFGRITVERDEIGRETRYTYDTFGNVIAVTAPDGSRTQIDYHETLNLPVAVNDPAGRITEYAHDEHGNLIQVTDPAGHTTRYGYNDRWLPDTITDALGKTKRLEYDSDGQLVRYTDCSGQTTVFAYNTFGDLESVTDALGHTTRHHYDEAGNHIRTDYPDGSAEHFEYDRLNRLTAHIDGLGAKTAYELAVDGLPLKRINALGHTFAYAYDKARRLTGLTNENGDTYRLAYGNTDNLVQETGWDGKITAYAYDAAGQLTQQTEYGQSKNGKGRLRPQEVPAAGKDLPETWHIHTFKRNLLGQLVEKQSRKVSHHNGRSKDHGISRTRFEYDPFTGNLVKARNRHSSVTLAYDVLDQLIAETTVHNGQRATVSYGYDPLGNRIQTTLPDGRNINSLYYGSGHLHQINLDGETLTDIERDQLHQETARSQGVLTSLSDYDPMGRLKQRRTVYGGNRQPSALVGGASNRRYTYDKAGNLIQTADQRSGVLDYVYDKLGRIESVTNKQTGGSEKFSFDPANNILSDRHSAPSPAGEGRGEGQTPEIPATPLSDGLKTKGRLKGINIGEGNRLKEYNGTEYTYDALGNLIYRQLPNGENQYFVYDTENQLTRAEIKKPAGNTEVWEYAYDPFGRRLSKERKDKLAWVSTEPKRTHFVWDGSRLLQEYTYKGNYTYIYTDQDSYEPLAQVFLNGKDDKQYLAYFHNDQIGIPREMTDQFGNLLWYGEYTAWGALSSETKVYPLVHQPFRLQNQYYDSETGLHYNFFRYYESETGRFINQDPIGLVGGENFYNFAVNVQGWIDPLGLRRGRMLSRLLQGMLRRKNLKVFEGRKIHQDHSAFDFTDENICRMLKHGASPKGKDGLPVNLHHLTGKEPGELLEIQESIHSKPGLTKNLHHMIKPGESFRNDENLNKQFNNFRKRYWRQRAKDHLSSCGKCRPKC